MKWINRLYIFFLGIILTITTGFGVAAFYPQPTMPKYLSSPIVKTIPSSCNETPQGQASPECQAIIKKQEETLLNEEMKQQEYEAKSQEYQNTNAGYTRTAIFLGIAVGALFAILGIVFIKNSKLISTGLLLASVLTAVFTRLLINLASLGSSVSGTARADNLSYVEFGALLLLSVAVIVVGKIRLDETTN